MSTISISRLERQSYWCYLSFLRLPPLTNWSGGMFWSCQFRVPSRHIDYLEHTEVPSEIRFMCLVSIGYIRLMLELLREKATGFQLGEKISHVKQCTPPEYPPMNVGIKKHCISLSLARCFSHFSSFSSKCTIEILRNVPFVSRTAYSSAFSSVKHVCTKEKAIRATSGIPSQLYLPESEHTYT